MMSPSHHRPVSTKQLFTEDILDYEEYDWLSFPYWAEALSFAARADAAGAVLGLAAPASSGVCEFINWLQQRDPTLARLILRCKPEFIAVRDCIDERCDEEPQLLRGDRADAAAAPPSTPRQHQPPPARSSSAGGELRQLRDILAPRAAAAPSSPRGDGSGGADAGKWVRVAARGGRIEFWYDARSGRSTYAPPPREQRRAASAPVGAPPASGRATPAFGSSGHAGSGDRVTRASPQQPADRLPPQHHHHRPPRAVPVAAAPSLLLASRQQEHQHHRSPCRSPPHPPHKQMRGEDHPRVGADGALGVPALPSLPPSRRFFAPLPSAPAAGFSSQYRRRGNAA